MSFQPEAASGLSAAAAREEKGEILMPMSPDSAALLLLCRPNGTLTEVIYDEVGLKPAHDFVSLIHSSNTRKAKRFLRTAVASHWALDWELGVALAHGIVPLFFSASMTSRGIVVVGMKDPVSAPRMPEDLSRSAQPHSETLAPAFKGFKARKQAKARAQRRLRSELLRLNHAVAASHTKIAEAGDPKAASELIQLLLRIVAHDLRNPVSGIMAASQYLIEDAAHLLDGQHLTLLNSIEASSRLMLRLIEDISEMPSGGSGAPELHFQPIDPKRLVEQSVAVHRPLAETRGVGLEMKAEGAVPMLDLDPQKIMQALNALLTNAVRSSQPGGHIEVTMATKPRSLVIEVRYEGTANSASDLRAIFEPAHKGRSKRGLKEARTALTLATVRRIVEAHGGTVQAGRDTGNGSNFVLKLPLSRQRSAKPAAAEEPPTRGVKKLRAGG